MRIYRFGTFSWEDEGYFFGLNENVVLAPSVEPQILLRTGNYPTFGITQVGAMTIAGEFGTKPNTPAGNLAPELAFLRLYYKLDPALGTARTLYMEREDGVLLQIPAILALPHTNDSSKGIRSRSANFVCCQPWWKATGAIIGSGIFS